MKKILIFLMVSVMSIVAYGIEVSTTIFPIYDAVRVIGGDRVNVNLLVKPGVEPHSFEPSPRDIARINNSDIFLYLDDSMETWIDKFKKNIDIETVKTAKGIELYEVDDDEHGHDHNHHKHSYDPHIWLDPILYIKVVQNVTEELIRIDPQNKEYYSKNLLDYEKQLNKLNEDIVEVVDSSKYKKIIYAGHFSFGYFTKRYELEYVTAYKNTSPNANIGPRDLQKIIEEIKNSGQKFIYQETLVNDKTAKLISSETNTEILLLHQLGGISKKEMESESSYIELMRDNLENIKKGLEYEN